MVSWIYRFRRVALIVGVVGTLVGGAMTPRSADAAYCYPQMCPPWWQGQDFTASMKAWLETNYFTNFFIGTEGDGTSLYYGHIVDDLYKQKILIDLWKDDILPSLRNMTRQLVSAGTSTTGMIGGFFDAEQLNDTQLTLQRLQAEAAKDYTPGETLCRFGTAVRGLAASEQKSVSTLVALGEIGQNRQLGNKGGSADAGPAMDRKSRLLQFSNTYCDPGDNNNDLNPICTDDSGNPVTRAQRVNKDINYSRTIETKRTLDVDLTSTSQAAALTPDEEDVIAMSNNLYGHDVPPRLTKFLVSKDAKNAENQMKYLDLRQLVALRGVAQNSFNSVVAMRSRGATGASQQLYNILVEMGMSNDEAKRALAGQQTGSGDDISYNAQMEILTKKIYQNPNFYVNLIDKPANIERTQAAMQAFGLMQDRDLYQTLARQEVLLSLLLEMKVRAEQREVERTLVGKR